jgi:hypothetical protein
MLVADFQILFSTQRFDKTSITTQFKIVFISDSKVLETELKAKYPEFLHHRVLSPTENLKNLEMQSYILKRSKELNLAQVCETYFLNNKWMYPLNQSHVKTVITKGNSKFWTNPLYPYLELQGEITIDMEKAFDFYYQNKFIEFQVDKKVLHRNTVMKFNKPWPQIVVYQNYAGYRELILNWIKDRFLKNKKYVDDLEKATGLKNITKTQVEFRWRNNDIEIIIDNMTFLLSQKIFDNKFKILAGIYLLNRKYKK